MIDVLIKIAVFFLPILHWHISNDDCRFEQILTAQYTWLHDPVR